MESGEKMIELMRKRTREKLKQRGKGEVMQKLQEKKQDNEYEMKSKTGEGASKVEEMKRKIREKLKKKYEQEQ